MWNRSMLGGPGPWPAVHGCTRYIKLRPSESRPMVGILKTEGLSQDLIMTVRVGFNGARLSSEKEWRCTLC
jgi:hypothetical protein